MTNIDIIKKNISWYINESCSEMGMRSNFCTVLSNTFGSLPHSENEDLLIGCLKSIGKHRKILSGLAQLTRVEYRYIEALYNHEYQDKYPKVIKMIFEKQTGLVLCLFDDMELLLNLCTKRRSNSMTKEEERQFITLQTKVQIAYDKLHQHLKAIMR